MMRMQYFNNELCVEAGWLHETGMWPSDSYKRNTAKRVLRRGCKNSPALVAYKSLPDYVKDRVNEQFGNPYDRVKHNQFEDHIKPDPKAKEFFETYINPKGKYLKKDQVLKYYSNTIILDAVHRVANDKVAFIKSCGGRYNHVWPTMAEMVARLDKDKYPHSLPTFHRRLKQWVQRYLELGYAGMIHGNDGNDHSRKVNDNIERLLMSIYAMDTRPFASWVQEDYLEFLAGNKIIADYDSGEMFDREDFKDENGVYIMISESTAWNYLNRPDNKAILEKMRTSGINFKTKTMPFNHRHHAQFTLSKVSFDDRALPRKTKDGKWVQSYIAVDPLSQCVVGAAYSLDKDLNLVHECFRDMHSTLEKHNLPWPAEAEVERHLMSSIKDVLNGLFAYVRFCNPQNSREKRAEHIIKVKKYGAEKRTQANIGRWSNKSDHYQVNTDKVEQITIEQAIADDKAALYAHNHSLHPDQEKFKGKTRWQVLVENLNPELAMPQKRMIARYIGFKTTTTVRNNDYVRVQYNDYAIETINILARMKPKRYEVDAYWMPNTEGNIPDVYLYQDEDFLCRAVKYETYNEALAERTDRDEEIRRQQSERQNEFRHFIKEGVAKKVAKVDVLPEDHYTQMEQQAAANIVPDKKPDPMDQYDFEHFETDSDWIKNKAINDL